MESLTFTEEQCWKETQSVREYYGFVQEVVGSSFAEQYLQDQLYPGFYLQPRPDVLPLRELVANLLSFNVQVAEAVNSTHGDEVETVINPLSGTDVIAPLSYLLNPSSTGPKKLITIDAKDMFVPPALESGLIIDRVLKVMHRKLNKGWHFGHENHGFIGLATELALLGVDPDSVMILGKTESPRKGMPPIMITDAAYMVGGVPIRHSHIAQIIFPEHEGANDVSKHKIMKEISDRLKSTGRVIALSKAGMGIGIGSVLPLLPEGNSTVVSDLEVNSKKVHRIQNDELSRMLQQIQVEMPDGLSVYQYGYCNVEDLNVYDY